MTTSGRRLFVTLEVGDGGEKYPWLVNAYDGLLQETPYAAATLADLATCEANRGSAAAPLLLVNHWLSGFGRLVTSAQQANTMEVLGTRAERCRQERQLPNIVAVNYADIGDVHAVVRRLNGVG